MGYDIILWDVDGTLMDFKAAEKQALSGCLQELGVEPADALIGEYSRINISYWKRFERGELTKEEVLLGRFVEFLEKEHLPGTPEKVLWSYEEKLSHTWFIQDDSLELCRILKAKGFRQYVVTNGWSIVQWTKLEESGFNPVMDGCFISDDLGVQKPKKEFFEACFTEIFGRPEPSAEERSRVLIVGDSLTSDMLGGLNVGIDRCWYSSPGENENPEIPVTCRIKYLWELLPILGIE